MDDLLAATKRQLKTQGICIECRSLVGKDRLMVVRDRYVCDACAQAELARWNAAVRCAQSEIATWTAPGGDAEEG